MDVASLRPANRSAILDAESFKTLTQNMLFRVTACDIRDSMRKQTSTEGGSADTEQNAVTVAPWRPAGPSVVTTATLFATERIARTKFLRSTFMCRSLA
jgi:hypothetical protein